MDNSESLSRRVRKFFGALDALDADAVAAFFAPAAVVRVAGAAPIAGRTAIRKALVEFMLEVEDLRHEPVQVWTSGDLSVFEADMTLTLSGRTPLTFPITHIIRWAGGFIEHVRVSVYLESRLALAMSNFDRTRALVLD